MFSLFYFIPLGAMDNGVWLSPSGGVQGEAEKPIHPPSKGDNGIWMSPSGGGTGEDS